MKKVFLVCTEHHIALSIAIIKKENLKDCHILFTNSINIKNSPFLIGVENLIKDLGAKIYFYEVNSLFLKILFFNPLKRILKYKLGYKKIKKIIGSNTQSYDMFIFADQSHITQFIISYYKNSKFNLVQDGLAQYVEHKLKRDSFYKTYYYKIIFGFFWKGIRQLGEYTSYKNLYCLYPKLISNDYSKLKLNEINLEHLYNDAWIDLSNKLLKNSFPEFFQMDSNCGIFFVSRFNSKNELEISKKVIIDIAKKNILNKIYIKNHPRSRFKLTSLDSSVKLITIPTGIPAECFFALNKSTNNKYFLSYSTLLLICLFKIDKSRLNVLPKYFDAYTYNYVVKNKNLYSFVEDNFNLLE